jgi:hypothetical protein
MTDLLRAILAVVASLFKSRAALVAENLVRRQQISVLRRRMPSRPALSNADHLLFVWLYRWFPSITGAFAIVRPETVIRWHRAGFRAYWRWRSRHRAGRPKVCHELRALIAEMSQANPLRSCMDAPSMQEVFRTVPASDDRVLSCIRPGSAALHMARAGMEIRRPGADQKSER